MLCNTTIRNLVRGKLLLQGKTLHAWATDRGFSPKVAARMFARFAGESKRPKAGTKSLAVIEALEKDTGIKICG